MHKALPALSQTAASVNDVRNTATINTFLPKKLMVGTSNAQRRSTLTCVHQLCPRSHLAKTDVLQESKTSFAPLIVNKAMAVVMAWSIKPAGNGTAEVRPLIHSGKSGNARCCGTSTSSLNVWSIAALSVGHVDWTGEAPATKREPAIGIGEGLSNSKKAMPRPRRCRASAPAIAHSSSRSQASKTPRARQALVTTARKDERIIRTGRLDHQGYRAAVGVPIKQ